jgi:hypothetical protein
VLMAKIHYEFMGEVEEWDREEAPEIPIMKVHAMETKVSDDSLLEPIIHMLKCEKKWLPNQVHYGSMKYIK